MSSAARQFEKGEKARDPATARWITTALVWFWSRSGNSRQLGIAAPSARRVKRPRSGRGREVRGANGQANYSTDHVRRRRNATVAGLARGTSETVPAAVREAFDVSGHAVAGFRRRIVRAPDCYHQYAVSLYGARAACRNRYRGGRPARANETRFRPGDCRRRGVC